MALRAICSARLIKYNTNFVSIIHQRSTAVFGVSENTKGNKLYKTEHNLNYLGDPDNFGTLISKQKPHCSEELDDEGDIKEQEHVQNLPLTSQKLTIKQYADIIKQYLKHKRLKEAIDVLEVRMLKEDRVKPENYIYNILIGGCADLGYTKKAFKLYNDMKKRALKPTGDTYTCLFEACFKCPWPTYGIKNAKHLRELMIEKGIEPNLTNYNAMIKAFGRCGDLPMAFKIVDEMVSKNIKIRVHTFNHLLHACISDKESGLRHALLVWRKLLRMKEKPNIFTFNLILKCVRDCNLGSKENIKELVGAIQDQTLLNSRNVNRLQIGSIENRINQDVHLRVIDKVEDQSKTDSIKVKENSISEHQNNPNITFLPKTYKSNVLVEKRSVPNLLSKVLQMDQVFSLQEVSTAKDRFAVVGGQDDFLKEMEIYFVKPDIKTFTQMLSLVEETREDEDKIMKKMKSYKIKMDIDFFNMLIKRRCLRSDYEGAFLIKDIIDQEACRKIFRRKKTIKPDIITYGVLALACKTKENAEKLLNEMKEKQLKVNIEILGTLLRHGTAHMEFEYIIYIMNIVKQENLRANEVFLKHLESFHNKCLNIIKQSENIKNKGLVIACKNFMSKYHTWLKDIHEDEIKSEHPWKQFNEPHPVTVQRQHIQIKEPKKFYKRNRKYIPYVPSV